jgi:hypothetical protein
MTHGVKHTPADSATVAAFWCVWFALANGLAFRKTLCGGIGGLCRFLPFHLQIKMCRQGGRDEKITV